MTFPLHLMTQGVSQLCQHCGSAHKLLATSLAGFSIIPRRNNWRKNYAKREAKKEIVNEYVGENPTKASIIYAWGYVNSGAIGIPSYVRPDLKFISHQVQIQKINRPARVRFFDINHLKPYDIACGYGFTVMAVKSEKKRFIVATGLNTDSQIGFHEGSPKGSGRILDMLIEPARIRLPLMKPDECKVVTMACGRSHSVFVIEDEGVFTLGNNAYGQCGRSIVEGETYNKNQAINKLTDTPPDIVKVVCGQDHTLVLTESGHVYSCGLGADGQTGLGHFKNVGKLERVKGDIEGEKIVSIGSRGDCTLAVSDKGELFGWGNSEYNQLGLVTTETQLSVPKHIPVLHCGKVLKAVAGGSQCALINDKGQVFVWGYGILGKGPNLENTATPSKIPEPIFGRNELSPDIKVVDIECGLTYVAARTDKGDVYTWGRNNHGVLGLGEDKNQFFPWRVALPAEATRMACGLDHMATICKAFT
ncbi:RCC1-like G exchanging factor-like protein [Physella acuta]|uniref:RCC1-like G exchanging factor-like protein n=1 Tax=Physella acuta TaxID=109671 RepID=UPI0027DCE742|nr:RCC1-like G exchanging factor-like protein [Physella acuta]XP_059159901.1 RCC1-like G exchanging factor-like protein [Physella acuta]